MTDTMFISQENKALVWQLLLDANAFINIPDSYFKTIQEIYEKLINEISQLSNLSLKDKNKLIMSKMFEKIKYFNNQHIQKPLEEVKIQVQEQFKNKQEEFIKLVNHNKPKDVSFNEEIDKPFDTNELNTRLNQIIANRSYDTISKPLDEQESSYSLTDNNGNDDNGKNDKKVKFIPSTESILSKLKPLDNTDNNLDNNKTLNNIYNLLKTISSNQQLTIKNQDKILELLNK